MDLHDGNPPKDERCDEEADEDHEEELPGRRQEDRSRHLDGALRVRAEELDGRWDADRRDDNICNRCAKEEEDRDDEGRAVEGTSLPAVASASSDILKGEGRI